MYRTEIVLGDGIERHMKTKIPLRTREIHNNNLCIRKEQPWKCISSNVCNPVPQAH